MWQLRVVILDPFRVEIIGGAAGVAAPGTPHTTSAPGPSGLDLVGPVVGPKERSHEQEDCGDGQRRPRSPAEAEVVFAKRSRSAGPVEVVASLGEDGRHQADSDGEQEQGARCHGGSEDSAETAAAGHEGCEEGEDFQQQCEQVEYPAEPPHVEVVIR